MYRYLGCSLDFFLAKNKKKSKVNNFVQAVDILILLIKMVISLTKTYHLYSMLHMFSIIFVLILLFMSSKITEEKGGYL